MTPNPSVLQRQLTDLFRRVSVLEKGLADCQAVYGAGTTAEETVLPLISITPVTVGSSTSYVLVFPSAPGELFQVQESHSLPDWTDLASPIAAAAAPAISTSWTSGGYTIDNLPVYFRVRKFPQLVSLCPPVAPCACS